MSASELLTLVVIVIVLVAVLLPGASFLGRRLETARRSARDAGRPDSARYFVRFFPGADTEGD